MKKRHKFVSRWGRPMRGQSPDPRELKPEKLNSYRAEYRGEVGRGRGRNHSHQDYEQIMVVAPNFYVAAELAKEYGNSNFPKLALVSIEIETDHVAL